MRLFKYAGYAAIPLAFLVHFWFARGRAWEPSATFALAGIGVIPLATLMGAATERLAERVGPTWGGLLNATFGNAAELIIGVVALSKVAHRLDPRQPAARRRRRDGRRRVAARATAV
jgi:Ca2+:H+ antiporter